MNRRFITFIFLFHIVLSKTICWITVIQFSSESLHFGAIEQEGLSHVMRLLRISLTFSLNFESFASFFPKCSMRGYSMDCGRPVLFQQLTLFRIFEKVSLTLFSPRNYCGFVVRFSKFYLLLAKLFLSKTASCISVIQRSFKNRQNGIYAERQAHPL